MGSFINNKNQLICEKLLKNITETRDPPLGRGALHAGTGVCYSRTQYSARLLQQNYKTRILENKIANGVGVVSGSIKKSNEYAYLVNNFQGRKFNKMTYASQSANDLYTDPNINNLPIINKKYIAVCSQKKNKIITTYTFTSLSELKVAVDNYTSTNSATSDLAKSNYGPINNWGVSQITSMKGLFKNITNFNDNINNWITSSVTDMSDMFNGATSFNMPLDNWDVSKVQNFENMFNGASKFNQNLSNWKVIGLQNIGKGDGMFSGADMSSQYWTEPGNLWQDSVPHNSFYSDGQPLSITPPLTPLSSFPKIFYYNVFTIPVPPNDLQDAVNLCVQNNNLAFSKYGPLIVGCFLITS